MDKTEWEWMNANIALNSHAYEKTQSFKLGSIEKYVSFVAL